MASSALANLSFDDLPLDNLPPNLPIPPLDTREFSPLVEWALEPINERLVLLGIPYPDYSIREALSTRSSVGARGIELFKLVIEQVGWITWDEYCLLVISCDYGGVGGAWLLQQWTTDPKRLRREIRFLKDFLEKKAFKPFAP